MNTRIVLFFTVFTAVTMAFNTVLAQNSIQQNSVQINEVGGSMSEENSNSLQEQKTVINIDSAKLKLPHILSISTPIGTQVTGQISVNGVVIKRLTNPETSINLSSYLSRGRQTITISGSYKPAQSSVEVTFSSPGTQVSQETGGGGILRQTLIIDVR